MTLDTSNFKDKDSKVPEYRELYEKHPFIQAYAKHTDMRIEKDGPELAIGAKPDGEQDWEKHGLQQLGFLRSQGLKPESFLLDIGCGTGRLAQQAIPYLNSGCYLGTDISHDAIGYCYDMVKAQGLSDCMPTFLWIPDGRLHLHTKRPVDIIWAHSVFTHLPPDCIGAILGDIARLPFGQFFFTYKLGPAEEGWMRTGLKQFCYYPDFLAEMARAHGLRFEAMEHVQWPAGQRTGRITRGAS